MRHRIIYPVHSDFRRLTDAAFGLIGLIATSSSSAAFQFPIAT